mmetsp:Transcript_10657/g.20615  ORF Transcript_10657/g.20615 Transcript_10657/m.20615 type:complete len:893 (-) Transcript_10657:365-3043(-)
MAPQLPPGLGSKRAQTAPCSQPPGLGSSKIEPAPAGQKPNKNSHSSRRHAGNGVFMEVAKTQTSVASNVKSIHLQMHAVQTSGGTVASIPAIDSHWARPPLDIPVYLPSQGRSVVELTAWHAALPELQAQLDNLLVMPLHIFWSYVLYDATLLPFIDSVLRFAPRYFDLVSDAEEPPSDGSSVASVHSKDSASDSSSKCLAAATFRVLLRIATPMQSKQEFLDADHWRELVYDNWVIDAPKLLDACALYGFGSPRACGDLISRMLSLQPRYAGDMCEAIGAAAEALSQLCGRDPTQPLDNVGRTAEVWALPMPTAAEAKENAHVLQLADWMLDCAGTLHGTLRVSGESLSSSLEALLGPAGLITAIQMAVEVALPTLASAVQAAHMSHAERKAASATLRAARVHFVHAAHQTLRWCVFFPASGKRGEAARRAQQALLAAAKQMADPCRQLRTLKQVYERGGVPWLPAANATGVADAAATDDMPRGAGVLWQQVLLIDGVQGQLLTVCDGSPHRAQLLRLLRPATSNASGAAAGDGCSVAEREAVSAVRDVFPDLGTGFILSALRCFGGSPTTVVEALLEDKLPESLRHVPRSLERLPSDDGAGMHMPPPPHQQQPGVPLSFKQKQKLQRMEQRQKCSAKGRMVVEGAAAATSDQRARTPFGRLVGDRSDAFRRFAIESVPVGEELYDDELDDSLQLGASAVGGATGEANGDDAETERVGNASVAQHATSWSGGGASAADLPTTAPEWVRAIGLGQYAEAFRAKGILRLEIAATLTVDDLERMHVMEKHRGKLLSSAARLGERLKKRGKTLPSLDQADTSGYAQVSAIHYDEETGDFWGEDGRPQNQPPAQPQERSSTDHVSVDRRRQLNDRRKARLGNHNRKARAYRRQGPE